MKNENEKLEIKPLTSPLERLGGNIEVLKVRLDKMDKSRETENLRMNKVDEAIKRFKYDLDNPKPEYGYTPTRAVAVAALKQSTGFISTDNLENHAVIKDIVESVSSLRMKTGQAILTTKRIIEEIPSPDNMQDLLNTNFTFKELERKITNLQSSEDERFARNREFTKNLNDFRETYNGADHPTGPEFDAVEMDYEELRDKHNDLVHFLKGVFSSMKHDPVANCIEEYKIGVKERSKGNE